VLVIAPPVFLTHSTVSDCPYILYLLVLRCLVHIAVPAYPASQVTALMTPALTTTQLSSPRVPPHATCG
jgi:hypothetical protein